MVQFIRPAFSVYLIYVIVSFAHPVGAADSAGGLQPPTPPSHLTHVRSTNDRLAKVIGEGYVRSATFRRLMDALGATDEIVYVESGECDCRRANACLMLSAATANVRYVRASVSLRRLDVELIEQIGHELQHAMEIAGQPGITNKDALETYYGAHSDGCGRGLAHCFETAAARSAGDAVRAELYRPKASGPSAH